MHDLFTSLEPFGRCQIAVVGDLMLDEYLWGHMERISPEAPVPILNVVSRESMLGGAGNVVENLRSLGVSVSVFGVVGKDETGEHVRHLLEEHGADTTGVILDPNRKTTRKTRLMSLEHGRQVFRSDDESTHGVSGDVEKSLIGAIRGGLGLADTIVCSDYLKGVLTRQVLGAAFETSRELGIPNITGPKDSNFRKYQGAAVLMPNSRELAQLVGTPMDGEVWLNESARALIESLALEALIVTRGREGMSLFEKTEDGLSRVDVPTTARSVFDVTGAGDTALATFAAAIACRCDRKSAVRLANLAAGIKVGKPGSASVSLRELERSVRGKELGARAFSPEILAGPVRSARRADDSRGASARFEMAQRTDHKDAF